MQIFQKDLGLIHPPAGEPAKVPKTGFLATNHLNLMYMLSAGLLMPPSGFNGKHYRDSLEWCPGWIPLFLGKPTRAAIDASIEEDDNLKPCVAEVSLDGLSGTAMAVRNGRMVQIDFPRGFDIATDKTVLFPAPLPFTLIKNVAFRSHQDIKEVKAQAGAYNNVPLTSFTLKRHKARLRGYKGNPWPKDSAEFARKAPLEISQTAGGILAMMLHAGNRGIVASQACHVAFDPESDDAPELKDPILEGLAAWMRAEQVGLKQAPLPQIPDLTQLTQLFFWGAVERIARLAGSRPRKIAEDVIFDYFDYWIKRVDSKPALRISRLRESLVSIVGLGDASITELFKKHTKPFPRALILLFLRKHPDDLLKFEHSLLREVDWLAASILFGARSGWIRLPTSLRNLPGLAESVPHRMAGIAHRIADTGFNLGKPPARARPLYDLLGQPSAWNKKEQGSAVWLAKKMGWDCVETIVEFGTGDYNLSVGRSSIRIQMKGIPKAITTNVVAETFLDSLAKTRLSSRVEAEMRKRLR